MRIFRAAGSSMCNPQAPKISLSFWRGSVALLAALLAVHVLAVAPTTASDSPAQATPARALVGTAAPLTAIAFTQNLASPQPIDTPITLTTTATGGTTVQFQYWVYNANASPAWSQLQGYSATPTYTWTPSTPGNYYLSATAFDTTSGIALNQCQWYTISSPPVTAVSLSATPASPQPPHTPITLSAAATGGTTVQYQFWVYNSVATPTWSQLRGYSATATCAWTPAAPGSYYITVTANDLASNTAAVNSYWFIVTGSTLTGLSVTASPTTSSAINTPVTFTAAATGGSNVQYQFWIYNAMAIPAWSQLQGYSSTATCVWTPTAPGNYLLSATAQDGATGTLLNQMLWYTVTSTPLTAVSIATAPTSPQPAATSITITATPVGGTNVQYQLWVYNPAALPAWSQLQTYTASPILVWTPMAAGSYLLSVTAQDIPTGTAANVLCWYTITPSQLVQLSANPTALSVTNSSGTALNNTLPTTTTVTATVYQNGQLATNQAVLFSCTPSIGTFLTTTALTNGNGQAAVTYQAGAVAGQVYLYATCGSLTSQPAVIAQQPGPVFSIALTIAPPTATGALGTVAVSDANGNPVPNQTVTLALTSNNTAFALDTTPPVVTTGANGTATFNILNYDQAGTAWVTASMPGVPPTTQSISFTAQTNPQIINGNLTMNVAPSSATSFTLQFLEPPNTTVWAQVTNPSVAVSQYTLANTGGLSVANSNTQPVQSISFTTNAQGQVTLTYTAASQLANGITVTFYNNAAMLFANAYGTTVHFNLVLTGPTIVTATPKSATEIDLSWAAVANALSYKIQRSTDDMTWTTLVSNLSATTTTYADGLSGTPLQPDTTYYYQVCATTTIGASQYSVAVSALTFPQAPTITKASTFSSEEIDITWTTVTGALGYRVFYKKSTDATYAQFGTDIAPIPNAASQTLPVTGLLPNTSYAFEVAAFNASGASNSLAVSQSTTPIIPVQKLTVSTPAPQIYYSGVQSDILSHDVSFSTPITIKGTGANSQIPVGAIVSLFTDRGTFVTDGPGQTVSADLKTISGPLDANGTLTVLFQGRPPAIGGGAIVLPQLAELGTPNMVATAPDGTAFPLNNDAVSTLPQIVGPPHQIVMKVVNPAAPVNAYFATTLPNTPWGYMDQTLTVTAQVYDLDNQPVLANMPIWFGQLWTPTNIGDPPSVTYYESCVNAAYIRPALAETTNNGTVVNVGFGSMHSGEYTLQCFALIPNADPSETLGTFTNINPAVDGGNNMSYVLQNTLTSDSTAQATPVSASQSIWIDSYVAFNMNPNVTPIISGWGNPTITVDGNTVTSFGTTPPVGINCDGTQSARVLITGQDYDEKWVLPGTPFTVSGEMFMPSPTSTIPFDMGVASLFQDGDNGGVSIVPFKTQLYFNDLSQGAVICKGNGPIGEVKITYDSTDPILPSRTAKDEVFYIFGPDPMNGANLGQGTYYVVPAMPPDPNKGVIAGFDIQTTAKDTSTFTVPLITNSNQNFPNGYVFQLLDIAADGVPDISMQTSVPLLNGQVTLPYAWDLQGTEVHYANLYLQLTYYLYNQGLVTSPLVQLGFYEGSYEPTVVRPETMTLKPNQDVYLYLGDKFPLTASYWDSAGDPLQPGYTIQYQLQTLDGWVNTIFDVVSPAAATILLPPVVGNYNVLVFIEDAEEDIMPLDITNTPLGAQGLSCTIHNGFLAPTITVDPTQATATTISLVITDPNIAAGSFPTQYYVQYSVDGINWTPAPPLIAPASGATQTGYTIVGLTTKTFYQIRVQADTMGFDKVDDPSGYSNIVTVTTK